MLSFNKSISGPPSIYETLTIELNFIKHGRTDIILEKKNNAAIENPIQFLSF